MTGSLKDQTVLVIGRGSGLARAIVLAAQDAGAQVIAALGEQAKADYFARISARNPARRIGTPTTSPRASCSP